MTDSAQLPSNVISATDATFAAAIQRPGLVLVDFWATWCGPCKILGPTLERIVAQHPEVTLVKIDVDENQATAMQHQILSIPTVKAFKGGVQVGDPIIGAQRPAVYEELITAHAAA